MMAKKQDTDKLSELLANFNDDLLGDDLPQHLGDDGVKVERILLDLVRPDPVQPRRVLPGQTVVPTVERVSGDYVPCDEEVETQRH